MLTRDDPTLSPEVQSLQRRLTQWLARRPRARAQIPESSWAEAVVLARRHGVGATARALRLTYESLQTRVGRTTSTTSTPAATFVEISTAPPVADCASLASKQEIGGRPVTTPAC